MLSENQIKRVLKHCEKANEGYENYHGPGVGMNGDEGPEYFEYARNQGWCQALRLALEINGPGQINKKPLEEDDEE
jgi:hypothetical protein